MLTLALAMLTIAAAEAQPFNITHFIVPHDVPPGQDEVIIECRYDANFTMLSWFKGPTEFFRYKPGKTPSTMSFPILGVGKVDLVSCGPTACSLKLGALTEDASGLYRCDIERSSPPYLFETRSSYMEVHGHKHKRPLMEGLAEEFGEGDEILAYCRGARDSEFRWYINGREVEEMKGSQTLRKTSSRLIFSGVPPTVTVQCAEFRHGKLLGSKEVKARWRKSIQKDQKPLEQRNNGSSVNKNITFLSILLLLSIFNEK
ncbi:uncharacterized protein LOC134793992 [Cydia splendana]|uniref:uncharacterized protein LOC134793992 n=1 Tax=Cydia splendana TaxID=1100963 RepID=UPI00300C33C7